MIAAIALLPTACDPEPLPNTPDLTGTLYGTWVLDTKTVDIVTTQDGKTNSDYSSTDFTGDHFLLHLTDFMVAFAQEVLSLNLSALCLLKMDPTTLCHL